jgi:predicted 3-demethylubiquinone-9 3-methyltransferase (glyoxalase superfamily)
MMASKLTTCLWFDGTHDPEEAANFYTSIFPNSHVKTVHRMTISFTLNGHSFVILNGGPHPDAQHNDAISFIIECEDQAEVDHYYGKLGEGGAAKKKNCGWVADRYGVAWQVVPKVLYQYMKDEDAEKVGRVTKAMMGMKKLDVEGFKKAYDGRE